MTKIEIKEDLPSMITTKTDLDLAQEKRDESLAAYERATAEMEAAAAAAEQRRQAAYTKHDRQVLADYDETPYDEELRNAETALTEAILADPVWSAFARFEAARLIRARAQGERQRAANWLRHEDGGNDQTVEQPYGENGPGGGWPADFLATALRIVERTTANQVEDVSDSWERARTEAGEAAVRSQTGRGRA